MNNGEVKMALKQPNLNGPETMPLREVIEHFPLTITIYDKNDKPIRTEEIDYGNRAHRIWLGKITFWACNQGYVVETAKANG